MAEIRETLFQRVFDSLGDPVVVYDRDLRILDVNVAMTERFPAAREEILGKPCGELLYGRGNLCEPCGVRQAFHTGRPFVGEKTVSLPDGNTRVWELRIFPVKGSRGKIREVAEVVRDITEQRGLEKELRDSEERYRTMVEIAREGIYIVDAETRVTFANQCLARMLGYPMEQVLGRSLLEFMDEESRGIARQQFERRRRGLSDVYELRLTKAGGAPMNCLISVAPLVDNGSFRGAVGLITDITCLKRTEAKLRAAKAFSERIINSITDSLVVIDPRSHRIVQANESFLARVALGSLSELSDPTCFRVLLGREEPCDPEKTGCLVRDTFESKRPARGDRSYVDARGTPRVFEVTTYPVMNSQGEVDLVIRLDHDVTERRKMEEALANRSLELQKAQQQLEALIDISRRVSTKGSISETLQYLHGVGRKIFPQSDSLFFILNPAGDQFLRLEECPAALSGPLHQMMEQISHGGLLADFCDFLAKNKQQQIVHHESDNEKHPVFRIFSQGYPSWFGVFLCPKNQCLGLYVLGSRSSREYPQEDLRFFQALFEQVAGHIRHLVQHETEVHQLKEQAAERASYGEIIGRSKKMQEVYELIDLVSSSDATVLITGENGTGKELVARAIHKQGHRSKGPFVVANCSAYSPTLLESELFGHERGAFTGAIHQKKGRIERAHGGTLFLDEIGDIAPATQILLLRFLQDHCFERVGGEKTIEADVRVLAATNRDLLQEARGGRFRDDLYYRLNVISIHLPPLRERKEDVPILAEHFLRKSTLKEGKKIHRFSSDAMQALMDHEWPGNVRQLENAVSHSVIVAREDVIKRKHLPRFLREGPEGPSSTSLAENERQLVLRVLRESDWNKHEAARRLAVSRSTLYSMIRRYRLEPAPGGSREISGVDS